MMEYTGLGQIVKTATSLVEKIIEFRFLLLFISFILLLDSCLVIFSGKNILQAFNVFPNPVLTIGNIFVFIALYAYLVVVFFPFLRKIFGLPIDVLYIFYHKDTYRKDYYSPHKLKEKALREKDNFILSYIYEYEQKQKDKETNKDIGFGLGILFLINLFCLGGFGASSITNWIISLTREDYGFWLNTLFFLIVWSPFILLFIVISYQVIYFYKSFKLWTDGKIYFPIESKTEDTTNDAKSQV